VTGAQAAKAAAGAALCLVGGWWVVKTSAVDALARGSAPAVATAASVSPDHPQPKLTLASMQLDIGTGTLPDDARRSALEAFKSAPLAEEPILVAALGALRSGRVAEGERLLIEARRRNPRNRTARLFLVDRYLRTGRVDQAGVELAALRRLIPGVAEALAPQLALMVRDERAGASLIRVLSRDPSLQELVLSSLATSGADTDLILRLARSSAVGRPSAEGRPWQRQLLMLLIERRDFAGALQVWRSSAGLPAGPSEKAVYDGSFRGLPGAVPFNWSLYQGSAGSAERSRTAGLDVQFFGRETVELAAQLMVLRPGRYRLSFGVEGNAKGDDSRLAWRVFCGGNDGEAIVEVPLRDIGASPRTMTAQFNVSPSCRTQWLRLVGVAGEFPGTQTVTVKDVVVAPGGGR
jgi:hypothetical protein